jgi:hypothetical protein
MSNQLYAANCLSLLNLNPEIYPGCDDWAEIYKMIAINVSTVDRTEKVISPFNFKLYDKFKMPKDVDGFNLSYEECCDKRAQELYNLSLRLDKPLYVFYSGGIDSTLLLISFIKVIPENQRERLIVHLSPESIRENPNFYINHIRGKLTTRSSEVFSYVFDKSGIIVGGELQDQIMGTDLIIFVSNNLQHNSIYEPLDKNFIFSFMKLKGMTEWASETWWENIISTTKGYPVEMKTNFDFLWWLNFNFKWQSVYFRMLLRSSEQQRTYIDDDFMENYYHHFFSSDYFQKWSMTNQDKKINKTWKSYKNVAKQIILDYTKDQEYYDHKVKVGSLYKLFVCKRTGIAITKDLKVITEIDPSEFYVENNSFIKKQRYIDMSYKTDISPLTPMSINILSENHK